MTEEWFDNDDFWRTFGDCMFSESQFHEASEQLDALLALAAVDAEKILDLGCGPGRHALPLADRGFDVTGVDLSAHLLKIAADKAKAQDKRPELVRADMREFTTDGAFDLVISMWSSFGYFEDPEDDIQVLANCYQNLREGGAFLLDIVGKEYVTRNLQPVHLTEFDDERILIERPLLEDDMTRYSNEWLLIEGDKVHRADWHHNLYSGQEIRDRLVAVGFKAVALYGSIDGDPYDIDAERLIAVAWKD